MAGAVVSLFSTCALADGYGRPYGRGAYVEPLPPPFSWTGFYVGGNIGGAWSNATLTDHLAFTSINTDNSGFIGGTQVGYNYQVSNIVFGIEWDFDWTSISRSGSGVFVPSLDTAFRASAETQWITTLAGRIGLASDHTLIYLKVGGGWVRDEASLTNLGTSASVSASNTNGGWLVGGGAEYAFSRNWTAKLEYDYLGLGDQTGPGIFNQDRFEVTRNVQMLKAGINYKF